MRRRRVPQVRGAGRGATTTTASDAAVVRAHTSSSSCCAGGGDDAPLTVENAEVVVDWGAEVMRAWGGCSESHALELWDRFIATRSGLASYEGKRHLADGSGVARVSPFLRHGQLSARYCHATLVAADAKRVSKTFARRIVWRDLAYWQLHHFPRLPEVPLRAHYAGMRWRNDDAEHDDLAAAAAIDVTTTTTTTTTTTAPQDQHHTPLRRWREGLTGYPLVDAGMRELRSTAGPDTSPLFSLN